VKSALALFWCRLGSLNALEMTRGAKSWEAWLGRSLSSADTIGRVGACLDAETLRPGIHHLYDRLKRNKALPDLYGLAVADALYAVAPFLNFLLSHGKQALVVLKDEGRNPYQDAAGLWPQEEPQKGQYRSRSCLWWDFADLLSWPAVQGSVRVVRSEESWTVKAQLTQQPTAQTASWVWLTTLSVAQARTEQIVRLAHLRWDVENHGFNELVNGWYADHVYRHHPKAIECFLLLAFLAYNVFHAFLALNLKPEIRRGKTAKFWARLLSAEIHADPHLCASGSSP